MKLRTIWPEDAAKARKCMEVDDETLRRDALTLKAWLRLQPHLGPLTGVDEDKWLQNYLLMNKNSVERAKAALDTYFRLRLILPDLFQDRDMSTDRMDRSFANTCTAFMPGLTEEGSRVMVYSHFTTDSRDFHPTEVAMRLLAIADICLSETVDRASATIIMDLKNTRINHLVKYNLSLLKNLFDHAWKAYPERVAAVHIVNPPLVMEAALALFKPFIKQKIRDRIRIHSKVKYLKQYIPETSIPSDYGGLGPSCTDMNRAWQTKMVECRDLLETVATHRSKENLRVGGKDRTLLDTPDSFRKLTLD